MKTKPDKPAGSGKRVLWSLLFVVIAALSVWTVTSQAKGFSPKHFMEYLDNNNPWWLAAAFLAMLAYIGFDALMVGVLLKGFGYPRSFPKCVSYAAADLYFSAITPSATGGQPMEAYFMVKDRVPAIISTVVMLTYLLLYTLSIIIIGLVCLVLVPSSFLAFGTVGRIFIAAGAVIQLSLAFLYALLLWNKNLLRKILCWGLRVLTRLRLIRNPEKRKEKLEATMDQYAQATTMLKGKRRLLLKTLLLNLAHRSSQILVTVFCFLAGGGSLRLAPKLFAMQSNVVIGAYCIPIPGSMGITDLLMVDGFSSLMSESQAANLELLARATSFYICILLCGLIVLVKYAMMRLRKEHL
ncbi:MAG: flippase-like domain-containing protein [Oscillospiraceae bacterium]|nr:flippase-like domain-containing protein [Oscillospiraceae bacterium]MBR4193979.1 flippase-like domain-containing protein [Oscillospiraceae bacterium]